MQNLKIMAASAASANAVVDAFAESFQRHAYPMEPGGPMKTFWFHQDGSVTESIEMTEDTRSSAMDGLWKGRKAQRGAMATSQRAMMSMFAYDGDKASDWHVSPFNPKYKRAKPTQTSASVTWKSKWIPSYRDDQLKQIANAFPGVTLQYTCAEKASGLFYQIKFVDGNLVAYPQSGMSVGAYLQKTLSIPAVRRLWEASG